MTSVPRIGLIGAGRVGQLAHLAPLCAIEQCQVTALADHHLDRAKRVADKFNIPSVYANHSDLLASADVDAVVVVTHRRDAPPVVRDALSAGKHVLSEKPIAYCVEEARALTELADENKLTYGIGYMKRHDECVIKLKQLLWAPPEETGLGSLLWARFYCHGGAVHKEYTHETTNEPSQRTERQKAGLPSWLRSEDFKAYDRIVNSYSHDINLARHLVDPNLRPVHGTIQDETLYVSLVSPCGVNVLFDFASLPFEGWHEGVELVFETGKVVLRLPSPMDRKDRAHLDVFNLGVDNQPKHERHVSGEWAFDNQAKSFVADLRSGSMPTCSGVDGIEDLQLIQKIWSCVH